MIKASLIPILLLLFVSNSYAKPFLSIESGNQDSLISNFIEKNPKRMIIECLQDENLYLSADDNNLLATMEVSNPQLLLRFFMKGFSIYIDPTGKKKERFEIKLPAAEDLDFEKLGIFREDGPSGASENEKPNILPLVRPLNEIGMLYTINGRVIMEESTAFKLYLDIDNDKLYYHMLIPIGNFFNVKKLSPIWSIGIYSQEIDMSPETQKQGMMPPPPNGNDEINPNVFTQEISQWINFSFEQLSSLNIE